MDSGNKIPFIEFSNVSKNFKTIKALDQISFKINKGDIFGYIGPNGAGKTTTIKILVGLIRNFQGDVFLNGKNISTIRNELYKILGYLPQEAGFQNWRTVHHTLKTFGKLSGLSSNNLEDRIQSVLNLVNLQDMQNKKITHLSGGMVQKLRLAQALLHLPKLLVLDEPMAGLDPTSRYQIKSIIKDLANKDITIFFSSHILSDVQDIANKIGIINNGKIMRVGTPTELQSHFQIGNEIEIVYSSNSTICNDIQHIPNIEYVEKISPNKQIIHLSPDSDVDDCIYHILTKILENKCRIRNFNLLKPSLEEVYLKYVKGDY
ncbi:MAG: ATP-binding cassette domain-containing protein [Candidatus Helarchaeota archaeon]